MEVEKLYDYSYRNDDIAYVIDFEIINSNILKIKILGNAVFEEYLRTMDVFNSLIKEKFTDKSKIFLFHDYTDLLDIPSKTRIHYKDWVLDNIARFEYVFFYGLDIKSKAIIKTGKVLSNRFDKVFVVNSFEEALWKINIDKLVSDRPENKDELTVLLKNISVITNERWNGSIDNGRLKYETYQIDGNIILRKLNGILVKGDMEILACSIDDILKNTIGEDEKYFFYLDLKDLMTASLTSRKEATEWYESIMPKVENVAFFNLNPMLNLVVKFSMSLSKVLQKKVFIKEDLTDALRFVFTYKGLLAEKKERNFIEKFLQIFKSENKTKIRRLKKEVEELKLHQEKRLSQLFNLLGTISWNEVKNIEDNQIPDEDPFAEVFAATRLMQYDLNKIIEDRDKLIEKAQQSEMMTSVFLANMSHEIRTPLNGIIGFSEIIAETELDETQRKYIDIVQQNGETLLNIINDIIDISKFEANQITIVEKSFNLHALLRSIYETFNKLLKNNSVELKLFLPTNNDELIISDEHRIKQILTNLLSNANKFTNKGEISFGYDIVKKNDNEYIEFFVKDTGIGISKEDKAKIFERFTQLDSRISRKYGGSGLGLSISKNIVSLFNGEIWLESTLNKGTTFYFTIPYKLATTTTTTTTTNSPSILSIDRINIDDKKILIIEDDENNYIYLKELLSVKDENIFRAISGGEAINLTKEIDFDIILLDINLPIMNGWQIFNKIKEIKPDSKIIAQTANAFKEDIEKAKELGFNGYLTKPFNRKSLFDEINKVLK